MDGLELLLSADSHADIEPPAFDADARVGAQDRDGVIAEVLYPTVGLVGGVCDDARCATDLAAEVADSLLGGAIG